MRGVALSIIAFAVAFAAPVRACEPVDYLDMVLPGNVSDPALAALTLAYPDLSISDDTTLWSLPGTQERPIGSRRDLPPADMLRAPTVIEQFAYTYPLSNDRQLRETPWQDPGRIRNSDFFGALWFTDDATARGSLVTVEGPSGARFQVTSKRGVDCQLAAAFEALDASANAEVIEAFRGSAGGFNWRRIAGTDRLSAHSWGIAVDINPEIGGYWRWSGAGEGAVPPIVSRVPEALVSGMERYGFIWGGKWHHYDGMHFEYRPELILHSRFIEGMAQ